MMRETHSGPVRDSVPQARGAMRDVFDGCEVAFANVPEED